VVLPLQSCLSASPGGPFLLGRGLAGHTIGCCARALCGANETPTSVAGQRHADLRGYRLALNRLRRRNSDSSGWPADVEGFRAQRRRRSSSAEPTRLPNAECLEAAIVLAANLSFLVIERNPRRPGKPHAGGSVTFASAACKRPDDCLRRPINGRDGLRRRPR